MRQSGLLAQSEIIMQSGIFVQNGLLVQIGLLMQSKLLSSWNKKKKKAGNTEKKQIKTVIFKAHTNNSELASALQEKELDLSRSQETG